MKPIVAVVLAGAVLAAAHACTNDSVLFTPSTTVGPTTGGSGGVGGTMGEGGGGKGGSSSTGPLCGDNQPATIGCDPACDQCENGLCILVCNAFNDCSSTTVTCPAGLACELRCTDDACRGTTVQCPLLHACTVTCEGGQSCRDAHVVCAPAKTDGTCEMSCSGNLDVCRDAILDCGANQCTATCTEGAAPPNVECGSSCDCTDCG